MEINKPRLFFKPFNEREKRMIKLCNKGIWDETIPSIKFNTEGTSNYCSFQEKMMRDYPRGSVGEKEWEKIGNNGMSDRFPITGKGQGHCKTLFFTRYPNPGSSCFLTICPARTCYPSS
jgi:hypothetical protein